MKLNIRHVEELREKSRMSKTELAKVYNCSHQRICFLISGKCKNITFKTAEKLAAALGCGVNDIVDFEEGNAWTATKS